MELKVHYRVYNCLPLFPTLIQITHFLQIHLNIILPSTPGSSKWGFPSGFRTKTLYVPLLSSTRVTCPTILMLLVLITRIIFSEYRSLSSSFCSFLYSSVFLNDGMARPQVGNGGTISDVEGSCEYIE
jgi:hypothetical protein